MKAKTTDLTGRALDWAVGVAVGHASKGGVLLAVKNGSYSPTTNWRQLGPLIETCKVGLINATTKQPWLALCENAKWCEGDTPQIAACRAIVAAKLGDQVDVPEVLG